MRSTTTVLGNYSADIFSVNNLKPSLLLEEVNSYRDYRFYYLPRYRNGDVMCIITNPKQKPFPLALPRVLADFIFPEDDSPLRNNLDYLTVSVIAEQLLFLEDTRKIFSLIHTEGEICSYFHRVHRSVEDPWDQYALLQIANLFNPLSTNELLNLREILTRVLQLVEQDVNPLPSSLDDLLGADIPYIYRTPNLDNFAGSLNLNGERHVFVHINFRELLREDPSARRMLEEMDETVLPAFQSVFGPALRNVEVLEGGNKVELTLVYSAHEDWQEIMNSGPTPLGWILGTTVSTSRQNSALKVIEKWKQSLLVNS